MNATAIENKYRGKFCNLVGAELLRRATPFADPVQFLKASSSSLTSESNTSFTARPDTSQKESNSGPF